MSALSSAAPAAAPSAEKNALFIFELIVGDLHWSALQIGALALMGAAASAEGGPSLRPVRRILHDDTTVMRLALRYATGAGLTPDSHRALDRLYLDIQQTLTQLQPFLLIDALSGPQREGLRRVVPALRRVALSASDTISRIEPLYRQRLRSDYVDDAGTIRQFLARAARGDRSDFGADGVVKLPLLRQKRKSPRLKVSRPCRLALPGGEAEATLVDVSREGLGVNCAAPINKGQRVALLIDGRRMEATVARVEGGLVGVLLARPLPINDPLFKAA